MTRHNKTKQTRGMVANAVRLALPALVVLLPAHPGKASEDEAPAYKLTVRPSICVSYDSAAPCTMSMQVSWEGAAPADVCLRDTIDTPMLHCWQDTRRGSTTIDYANTVDVLYQLVEESSQGVLAEAEVKVINRDLRDSRKRRRHVWSIL